MSNIFLGESGITSTSANFLANIAKEEIKSIEGQLQNLSFTDKTIELITGDKKQLRYGSTNLNLDFYLKQIANLNSFCAWVREAIKFKEECLNKVKSVGLLEYCKLKEIEYPEAPEASATVTEEDIINEMSIKDRNEYLRLEAFASTFGKYIHPGGTIANAREEAIYRESVPNETSGDGRDMVIYNYTLSLKMSDINKSFMNLQSQYRDFERRLNSIKFKIKQEVNRRNLANGRDYTEKYTMYSHVQSQLLQELSTYIKESSENISNLKIVIPQELQETYKYLNSLGGQD